MPRDALLLAEMIEACERAVSLVAGKSVDDLAGDRTRCDALLWNFTVLGEAAARVSAELKARHPDVDWTSPSRLRNRIVHGYWSVDLAIIRTTASEQLPDFLNELSPGRRCGSDAVTETDLPVCMHIGSSGNSAFQPPDAPFSLTISLAFVAAAQSAVGLMMSPVPRKFPTVKFVMSEGGIGWVPAALERADRQVDRHRYWSGDDDLLPSEVCKRNFWFCMIEEPWGIQAARYEIGVDHILWESDYPHADTTFPNTQISTQVVFDGIPDDEVEMISYRNAERLFHWECKDPDDVVIQG